MPEWQGVSMSVGIWRTAVERSRPVARAGATTVARTLIESLEPRQLLSGHCGSTPIPALAGQPFSSAVTSVRGAAGVSIHLANADSAPVVRLGPGSSFAGYQYINPDGSAPAPMTHVVEMTGNGTLEIVSGGVPPSSPVSSKPKKIKPSDLGIGGGSDASGPSVTPLAQTPGHSTSAASENVGRIAIPTPSVGVTPAVPIPQKPSHSETYLGTSVIPQPARVANIAMPVGGSQGPVQVSEGLAYASEKAVDALAFLGKSDPAGTSTSYNFVHFNPSMLLNDAMAAFSQESATLSFVPMPTRSTARAWSITAAVIGLDALLIGYCYHRNRRQKGVVAALQASAKAQGR